MKKKKTVLENTETFSESDFRPAKDFSGGFFDDKLKLAVCFIENKEEFAINISEVSEIFPFSEVFSVPGTPKSIIGLIDLRGRIVTVLDPFGNRNFAGNAIIFNHPYKNLGITVSGQIDPVLLDFNKMEPVNESDSEQKYRDITSGSVRMEKTNYNILSIKKIRDHCRYSMLGKYRKQNTYDGGIDGS